jgi:hypothetical protein
LGIGLVFAALGAARASDKDTGLAGKWATDPVRTATSDVRSNSLGKSIIEAASGAVTQQIPGGGRGGPGRSGGIRIDPNSTVVEKGSSPDGVALILEIKLSKTKITGKVTEVVRNATAAIEMGKATGSKFEFTTYKKVNEAKIATVYRGELVGPTTIELTRSSFADKPLDLTPEGKPKTLVFHRVK